LKNSSKRALGFYFAKWRHQGQRDGHHDIGNGHNDHGDQGAPRNDLLGVDCLFAGRGDTLETNVGEEYLKVSCGVCFVFKKVGCQYRKNNI